MCPIFMSQRHANKDIWQRFMHVHIFYSSFYFSYSFQHVRIGLQRRFYLATNVKEEDEAETANKDKEFT